MPINKVFELGRRAVRKELVALRGERIGDEGEEGKGGIIIPKDKFKEFVEFQKRMRGRKIKEIGGSSKGMYIRNADIPKLCVILQQTWRGIYGKIEILL